MVHTATHTTMQGTILIHRARTGWVVETTGRSDYYDGAYVVGARVGHRVLLPYSCAPDMRGRDYEAPINEYGTTVAQHLVEVALNGGLARTLRRGHKVS